MKNNVRIFFTSFFTCILIVMTVFGLLFVAETSKGPNGGDMSLKFERTAPDILSLSFMGHRAELDLDRPEQISEEIGDWGIFILPRGARLILQWGECAKRLIKGESFLPPEPEYKNACLV